MKTLRAERITAALLVIISLFTIIMLTNSYLISAAGSDDALSASRTLYGLGQTCVCAKKHTVVRPDRGADGSISANEVEYEYQSTTGLVCKYKSKSGDEVEVGCNIPSPNVVMKKYIDAGVMDVAEATRFYNDAYASAMLVQQNLSTKTQTNWLTNAQSDLGIGRFNRAMFEFNNNAHFVYSFLIGFSFITSLLVFIMIFMKITWLPDHPLQRRNAMENIVTSGVAVILTGGIWIIISLFQSIFDRFWSSYAVYSKDWKTVGNMFLFEYRTIVTGVLGIATLTAMLMLIKNFTQLSFAGDNPSARKQKMISILFCGIAVAGLGGLTIFTGFFWNLIG